MYKHEFPDYDGELIIPKGFKDLSYHNDTMPRAGKMVEFDDTAIILSIWQDYVNVDFREYEDRKRFCLQLDVNGIYIYEFESDDWSEIETELKKFDLD